MQPHRALLALLMLPLLFAAAAPAAPEAVRPIEEFRERYATRKMELEKEVRSFQLGLGGAWDDVERVAVLAGELGEMKSSRKLLECNAREARAAFDIAAGIVNRGEDLPGVEQESERDADVRALKELLARLELSGDKERARAVRRKLDHVTADVRTKMTAVVIESLREQQDGIAKQIASLDQRIVAAAASLTAARERLRHRQSVVAQLELLDTLLRELDAAIAAQRKSSRR